MGTARQRIVRLALAMATAATLQGCCVIAGVAFVPYAASQSGPEPTMELEEHPELVEGLSGTLVAADTSGAATLVDFPTRATRRIELAGAPVMVSGPDEHGRIAYVSRYWPWHAALLNCLLGVGRERAALRVECVSGGDRVELLDMSVRAARGARIQLSRRGGRVLLASGQDELRVLAVDGDTLPWLGSGEHVFRSPQLSDDGAHLHFERCARAAAGAELSQARGSWLCVNLNSAAKQPRSDCGQLAARPVPTFRWTERPYWPVEERSTGPALDDLGLTRLEFADGKRIYAGLSTPAAGARRFPSFVAPGFEHALRLRESVGEARLTLVPRLALGAWSFSEVRLER